jgi:hypothetical protein
VKIPKKSVVDATIIRDDTMKISGDVPAISVVIVSDYGAGRDGAWADIRKTLAALAAQDFEEPVEFILCESEEFREDLPADLSGSPLADLKILFVRGHSAYDLKNAAAASGQFLAFKSKANAERSATNVEKKG